jgi:flagellar basal body L-ring protein FlgH
MESTAQMVGDIITVQFAESFQATKPQNPKTPKPQALIDVLVKSLL